MLTAESKKQRIMADAKLSDIEKLREVFNISKNSLKGSDPQLYYAILGVLDKFKQPDTNEYFSRTI